MTRAAKASDRLVQQLNTNARSIGTLKPTVRVRKSVLAAPGLVPVQVPRPDRIVTRRAMMDSLLAKCMDLAASVPTVSPAVAIPVAGVLAMCMLAWADAKRLTSKPKLTYQSTRFNEGILSRIPTLRSLYKPLPFLTNGHVETIFAAKARKKVDVEYRRENLHMPDGGVVSLDWRVPKEGDLPLADDAPVLILLPGLTGGSDDSYVRYAVHYAESHGTRAVVFNSRGCGDTFLTTPRFYSGLYIGDMQRVADAVRLRYPCSQLFAAGWSLGANILVNYLGLVGEDTPIDGAAALCNPFDLTLGSKNLQRGFNRVYSKNLGAAMSRIMQRNRKVWNGAGGDFDIEGACNAASVWAWDDAITRVSFGFKSVEQYYAAAGSHQRVHGVRVPLLVIQAEDDPIAPIAGTPFKALQDNPNCILAVTKTGGHLGWVSGGGGYFGEPWTDRVITEWLLSLQVQTANDAARSLLGQAGSQLPKPPRNFSVSEGLAGGDSASSVGNDGSGAAAVFDPAWREASAMATPFDGVHLSPGQTGYDPAERANYTKGLVRQSSPFRASTAGSARAAKQLQTPPRLLEASPSANGSGHGSTAPAAPATEPADARANGAAAAAEEPVLGAARPPVMAAEASPQTNAQERQDGTAGTGSIAGRDGGGEEECASAPAQPMLGRPGNGAVRFAVSGTDGASARASAGGGSRPGPTEPVAGAGSGPAVMGGVRDAAQSPPLRKSDGSGIQGTETALPASVPEAAGDQGSAGGPRGAEAGQGGFASERVQSDLASRVSSRRIGDVGGEGARACVGEAQMRAGRAVATFLGGAREDAVLNDAWQESVVDVATGAPDKWGDSNGSVPNDALEKGELIKSLLANNAEALDAIASGRAGGPVQNSEGEAVQQGVQEAQVPASMVGTDKSVAAGENATMTAVVAGQPAERRTGQPVSTGFFEDVDPAEYSHHGFGDTVASRPARSVGSQSASSQGVWWNR